MGTNSLFILGYIVLFGAIFYMLAVRPQRKQRQKHSEMIQNMKKGDEIVTVGGLFGTVRRIGPDWVEVEIAPRTRVRLLKRAIASITPLAVDEEEYDEEEYADEPAAELESSEEAQEEEYDEYAEGEEGEEEWVGEEEEEAAPEAAEEEPEEPDTGARKR
jgi:preprotein translocase subunit YajC